jgi:hypothetical protein
MIKVIIPDILLVEWFTKSLLPPIARDVCYGWRGHRGTSHFLGSVLTFGLFTIWYFV